MRLCLAIVNRQLEYKGSWKKTAVHQYVNLTSFLYNLVSVEYID